MYTNHMKDLWKKPIVKTTVYLSLLAIGMNVVRLFLAENDAYVWLNWNLFLALIPILFAYAAIVSKYRTISIIFVLVWIGFLPNAPYIITDFIHLADVGPKSLLWYDAIMIFNYSLVGIVAYLISLRMIVLKFHFALWFPGIISLVTGFGIYLGRYIRFNTWHVITQPLDIIKVLGDIIIHPNTHVPVMTMTLSFAVFLFAIYLMTSSYILHEKTNN